MRRVCVMVLLGSLTALAGCNRHAERADLSAEWPVERRKTINGWMVSDLQHRHTAAGVVAQHTLYPHHFVSNGDELNELGERDAAILAAHYREHPGALNVRRGGAGDELYEARLASVNAFLAGRGVDVERLSLADADAGGDGLPSERAVLILETRRDEPLSEDKQVSRD